MLGIVIAVLLVCVLGYIIFIDPAFKPWQRGLITVLSLIPLALITAKFFYVWPFSAISYYFVPMSDMLVFVLCLSLIALITLWTKFLHFRSNRKPLPFTTFILAFSVVFVLSVVPIYGPHEGWGYHGHWLFESLNHLH